MASELRVSYEKASGGERHSGPGADLSLGGVFIETTKTLPVGALLSLEIEAGSTKVAVDARVLSLRAPGGPDKPGGMSVSFIDLPNDVASTLGFIVATRTKRKGTMLGLGEAEDDVPQYESASRLPATSAPPPPAEPPAVARPITPVMEKKAEPAPVSARHPTPPMMRSAPPSAPPPSQPPSHPIGVPTAPQAWGPASSPPSAPPPVSNAWGMASPMAAPEAPAPARGVSPILLIAIGLVVVVAIAVVTTWVFLGKLG